MSSLAATQADGYYRGTDYDPQRDGGLSRHRGSQLASNAAAQRGLKKGKHICKFEVPFKIWCLGCNEIVDKGVRFNAERKTTGAYHSTKILSFSFGCPFCRHSMTMRTDPQSAQYICDDGCRKKMEEYDPSMNETTKLKSVEERQRMEVDPMYNMEVKTVEEDKMTEDERRLEAIYDIQERSKDFQNSNAVLREHHRAKRKQASISALEDSPEIRLSIKLEEPDQLDIMRTRRRNIPAKAARREAKFREYTGIKQGGRHSREKELLAKAEKLKATTSLDRKYSQKSKLL